MGTPSESHWKDAKKVLRYLKETMNFGILYTNKFYDQLEGFFYSYWEINTNDLRYTSKYALNIGSRVVSSSNKKQPIVFSSSTKAIHKCMSTPTS